MELNELSHNQITDKLSISSDKWFNVMMTLDHLVHDIYSRRQAF